MPHVTCWNPVVNGSEDRSGLPSSGRNPIACRRMLPRRGLLASVVESQSRGAPGGRKPPVMAEVGQSVLREYNTGTVRFMYAKDLRGLQGLHVWQGTCNRVHSGLHSITLLSPVRWA